VDLAVCLACELQLDADVDWYGGGGLIQVIRVLCDGNSIDVQNIIIFIHVHIKFVSVVIFTVYDTTVRARERPRESLNCVWSLTHALFAPFIPFC
jgi:hypothetical protein